MQENPEEYRIFKVVFRTAADGGGGLENLFISLEWPYYSVGRVYPFTGLLDSFFFCFLAFIARLYHKSV